MIDLALTMGATVSEIEDRFTVDELKEIMRYAYENGGISPHRRLERAVRESAAMICLVMANLHGPKGKKHKLEDFIPKVDKELTAEDEAVAIESLLSKIGGGKNSVPDVNKSGIKWRRKSSKG